MALKCITDAAAEDETSLARERDESRLVCRTAMEEGQADGALGGILKSMGGKLLEDWLPAPEPEAFVSLAATSSSEYSSSGACR